MLSTISAMKTNMYAVQINLCIQLAYLEDQRNLKIYDKRNTFLNENNMKPKGSPLVHLQCRIKRGGGGGGIAPPFWPKLNFFLM